jgi:CheY-like chemotaxis protein
LIPPGFCVTVSSAPNGEKLDFDMQGATPQLANSTTAVLIVDDNEPLMKFMKLVLSHEGWELSSAATAEEALQLAQSSKFDLALIDYMLPDMDGASLATKLKDRLPALKMVMMTGGGEMSFSQQSDFAEVPVVQKPFIVQDLLQLLRSRIGNEGKEESAAATST